MKKMCVLNCDPQHYVRIQANQRGLISVHTLPYISVNVFIFAESNNSNPERSLMVKVKQREGDTLFSFGDCKKLLGDLIMR